MRDCKNDIINFFGNTGEEKMARNHIPDDNIM